MTAPALPRRLRAGAGRLLEAFATPLVPADYLDLVNPLRAGADLRARIVGITAETADAATITLQPGRGWRGHQPGQYVRIGVDIDGVRHWRAYSLTHRADDARGLISITVKAIPDGVVSNHLVHRARPGAMVMLDQATGEFTVPPRPPSRILFVTAGSGITPVMGMLRNRLADLDDVVHLHIAPTSLAVIFDADLRRYAAAGQLRLITHLDDRDGILDLAGSLDGLVPDWRDRHTWLCGPTGLLDAAERHWAATGLAHQLRVERFRPSVVVAGEGGAVTFARSDRTVVADGGTPLLDVAESADILMPSGCRMGICFGCVSTLRRGAVRDLRTGDLTVAEDGDPTTIQTCISAAAGDCELDR